MIQYNLYYGDEKVKLNIGEGYYDSSTGKVYVEELTPMSSFCREVMGENPVGTHLVYYLEKNVVSGTTKYMTIDFAARWNAYGNVPSSTFFFCFRKGDGTQINYSYGNSNGLEVASPDDETKLAGKPLFFGYLVAVRGYVSNDYVLMFVQESVAPYLIKTPWTVVNGKSYFLKRAADLNQYLLLSDIFGGIEPVKQFPGDTSDTGGGDGEYDITDIPILLPILPQYSATDTNFVSVYLPTEAQVKALASYVWGTKDFWTAVYKDMVANPMDLILGLGVIPNVGTITGTKNVKVGIFDTGVTMNYTEKQFFDFDCGKVTIGKYYGNAIDQSPNTRFSIFLPFIGIRPLNTDEIIGREIGIHYRIDVVSGQCLALIQIDGSVRYQYAGSCLAQIPFSGSSYNGLINAGVNMAIQTGTAIATGGATGAIAVSSGANFLSSMKPDIQRAGGIGGNAGVLGVLTPYIIRETPKQSLANDYNKFVGYPSNITAKLSELTGFTQIEKIRISGIIATDVEITEIEQLLKQGVIL